MLDTPTVNLSTARKNLSKILDEVFIKDKTYIITKGSIPVVKLVKVNMDSIKKSERKRKVDTRLFGYWKSDKRSSIKIEKELRLKAWSR